MGIAYQGHPVNLVTNTHCIALYWDGMTVVDPKLMRILESTHWKSVTLIFRH